MYDVFIQKEIQSIKISQLDNSSFFLGKDKE